MPGWNLHAHFANDLIKKYNVQNPIDFIVGSVFPDCPWLTTEVASMSGFRDRLHFYHGRKGMFNGEAGVSEWLASNNRRLSYSDFYKGMLSHITLDNQVNMLWNTAAVMEGFDKVSLTNGYLVTQDKAAHLKWEELNQFDHYKYGSLNIFTVYSKYDITEDCANIMQEEFGLTEIEIGTIIPNIKDNINSVNCQKEFEYMISTIMYDRALYVAEILYRNAVVLN